jgi:hypothetical protein
MKTLALVIFISGCTTFIRRQLPEKGVHGLKGPNFKSSLLVSSPRTSHILPKDALQLYFMSLGHFRDVRVIEDFAYASPDLIKNYDIHLELDFVSAGYFHPFCLITLAFIPCTPQADWALGAAFNSKESDRQVYLIREQAMEITWALGPLFPNTFGERKVRQEELKSNMLNNLIWELLKSEDHSR